MSVFVSGATGYVAKHIISQLLEQDYNVIASSRTEVNGEELIRKFNNSNLKIVSVGDLSLNAFDDVFKTYGKDIKYVIHVASPASFDKTNYEEDFLIPAVNGTKGILQSIKKYAADSVERFVITSSIAATLTWTETQDSNVIVNEKSWNSYTWENCQTDPAAAYFGSKKFAEIELWNFMDENKDTVRFKATAINPVFIFGPQTFDSDIKAKLNESCQPVNAIVHSTPETQLMPFEQKYIDVRDVAKAHILAFQKEELAGKRLILHEGNFNNNDILNYLNADFPLLKGKLAVGNPAETAEDNALSGAIVDNAESRKLLGFKFRNLRTIIDDMTTQILKHEGRL